MLTSRFFSCLPGGSIGVFRGSIRDITDPTNEASAYAILGFAWGMGGGMYQGCLYEFSLNQSDLTRFIIHSRRSRMCNAS